MLDASRSIRNQRGIALVVALLALMFLSLLATGLMIATLPVLVLYLFLSEWFVKGMTAGAIKG